MSGWHKVGAFPAHRSSGFLARLTPWVGEVGSSQAKGLKSGRVEAAA